MCKVYNMLRDFWNFGQHLLTKNFQCVFCTSTVQIRLPIPLCTRIHRNLIWAFRWSEVLTCVGQVNTRGPQILAFWLQLYCVMTVCNESIILQSYAWGFILLHILFYINKHLKVYVNVKLRTLLIWYQSHDSTQPGNNILTSSNLGAPWLSSPWYDELVCTLTCTANRKSSTAAPLKSNIHYT